MAEKNNTNINLNITTRKKFTIDGDRSRVIELDPNDLALVNRLSDSLKRMDDLKEEWQKLEEMSEASQNQEISDEDIDDEMLAEVTDFSNQFSIIETKMREIVDYIFDSEGLSQTIVGNSSIFSPVNGKYKFEQIIDVLTGLYEDSIEKEAKKINKRTVEAKTSKYIRNSNKK